MDYRYLNPKNDVAFKKIFGTEKNKDILIHFLNDLLHQEFSSKIVDVTIENPTQLPEIVGSKESVLDVLCTDDNGVKYIVEMQVSSRTGFEKRAQYYAAKTYSSQLLSTERYAGLKAVIFLAILEFDMFKGQTKYKSQHIILDKDTHLHHLKDFSFTFIELPKFTKNNIEDLMSYEDKWCYFFKHADRPDDMRKFLASFPDIAIIEKAYDTLEAHNWTREELQNYDRSEKIHFDTLAREDYVKAESKAEGKAETQKEIAQRLLNSGVDSSIIAAATQLTLAQIEEIKNG